jgi:hypothetical protein
MLIRKPSLARQDSRLAGSLTFPADKKKTATRQPICTGFTNRIRDLFQVDRSWLMPREVGIPTIFQEGFSQVQTEDWGIRQIKIVQGPDHQPAHATHQCWR